MSTYSVLLVSRNEGFRLQRTVDSVLHHAPRQAQMELVIVDDSSDDRSTEFASQAAYVDKPIRIVRNARRRGLIYSRAQAAELARGDYLAFLDAHCAVTSGWLETLGARLKGIDDRGLAVPAIYRLRPDWTFDIPSGGVTAGTISSPFLDFRWTRPSRIGGKVCAGVIGGGAWLCSAEWYRHLGGLDRQMVVWGMENIDFPLRTWAAGGWCLAVEGVKVGHLFNENPTTIMSDVDFVYNKIRAVHNVFCGDTFRKVMSSLAYLVGFRKALSRIHAERASLNAVKDYIESIRQRSDAWLIETFRLPLLERPESYLAIEPAKNIKSVQRHHRRHRT